ncbi:hypothetical protein DI09_95p60 [Mitosporidium daphniae]|uniref:Uncharacterized protein n=1 Tax=Mitosporidium daphniae TaxID=1485682 RepID=A0A098VLM8_9MICR|nr:uncharacterized protein DI09_95p60 [Mitosporidium daphniae]KGG50002.1 hypothetical protein DI09_95p60 [Mitosporidium daphniae]|eukprot:XP_013236438.1 uncharacterized protein DI09_95p60 [Mitosporidium daphniae]
MSSPFEHKSSLESHGSKGCLSSDLLTFDDLLDVPIEPSPSFDANHNRPVFSSSPIAKKPSKFMIDDESGSSQLVTQENKIVNFLDLDALESSGNNFGNEIEGADYDSAGSLEDFFVYTQDLETSPADTQACDEGELNLRPKDGVSDFYRFSLQTQANPFFSTTKQTFSHQDGKYKFASNFILKDQIEYDQKYGTAALSSSEED